MREVAAELRLDGVNEDFDKVEILMWRVKEDASRGMITEEALLWARHRPRHLEQDTWAVIHAFRHPGGDNVWHLSVSYVEPMDMASPHTLLGYRSFRSAPSASEICEFLRYVRPIPNSPGFRQTAGGFALRTWKRVAGQEPPCDDTTYPDAAVVRGRTQRAADDGA